MVTKKRIKNKKTLFAIGALVLVATIGGVIAANRTLFPFENNFELALWRTEVKEVFDSPYDWKPCDETPKVVEVKNTGTLDAVARVKVDEQWISEHGDELDLIKDNVKLADYTLANSDWVLRDGYYYLNKTLHPGESSEFINKVTFNCAADFGENEMVDGKGRITETTDDYNGASYHLAINAQLMMDDPNVSWEEAFGEYKAPQTFSKLKSGLSGTLHGVYGANTVKAFKRSKVLPDAGSVVNRTEAQMDGETPIYFWYSSDDQTVYWYSTADAITLHANDSVGGLFQGNWFVSKLDDASGLTYFDTRNMTGIGGLFYGDIPDDLSALAHWDVTGVTSFSGAFSSKDSNNVPYFKQKHMSAIEFWDVSNARWFSGLFSENTEVTDLSILKNWHTSSLTDLSGAFYGMTNLTSLKGLENWDVSHVTSMASAFYGTRITDLSKIAGWDVSSCTSFYSTFQNISSINDATVLNGWQVRDDATLSYMFKDTGIQSESGYPSWYTADRREN